MKTLIIFSSIYYLAMLVRNLFYNWRILKAHSLNARVISIGNVTWGGTGKTPLTAFMANLLLGRGLRPVILSRGYGNDEEALLSRLAPGVRVLAGKDRVKSGKEAIGKFSAKTLLLDDGFQYRRLKRDLDIICIDATNPFGNDWVIPTGILREGLGSLKRADIFLITKINLVEDKKKLKELEARLGKINPGAVIVKSIHNPQYFYKLADDKIVDGARLRNKDIVLVSAIGNPSSFEKTILSLGLNIKKHFIFRDHHWYKEKDLKKIDSYCNKNNIDTIVTTEKDAVRLRASSLEPRASIRASSIKHRASMFLVLRIQLELTDNVQGFNNRFSGIYNS
ncbi:MAG: tetraacyldisaccharide 4'-kinase [Candidatus Omnitrophica bacterium]|nr:tetraacyldisaccharide 4'-kinase [Candidatus Omnitrophota bacterium]